MYQYARMSFHEVRHHVRVNIDADAFEEVNQTDTVDHFPVRSCSSAFSAKKSIVSSAISTNRS